MGDKKRKQYVIGNKMKMINEVIAGKRKIDVANEFGMNPPTLNRFGIIGLKFKGY